MHVDDSWLWVSVGLRQSLDLGCEGVVAGKPWHRRGSWFVLVCVGRLVCQQGKEVDPC